MIASPTIVQRLLTYRLFPPLLLAEALLLLSLLLLGLLEAGPVLLWALLIGMLWERKESAALAQPPS